MHIQINRDELNHALASVKRGVARKTYVPVLANVMLSAARGRLNIRSTDLDKESLVSIPCATPHAGAVTLPGHALADLVKGLPKGAAIDLSVEKDATSATLRCGQMRLSLQSIPVKDFPKTQPGALRNFFALPCADLLDALNKTAFAMSTEETRYYLNGVFMHAAKDYGDDRFQTLNFVATDGHRLAHAKIEAPEGASVIPGVIIPRAAVAELQKLLAKEKGECAIKIYGARVSFTVGGAVLTTKVIDGTFPDYGRVIPRGNDKRLVIDTKAFIGAVTRVSKMSSERGRAIKLSLSDDKLVLSVNNPDVGTVSETLDSAYVEYSGAPLEIGFNAAYLLEMLPHVSTGCGVTRIMLSDPGSPTLFFAVDGAAMLGVLMPLRV